MSTPPLLSPEQSKPISLAKLATIFAITFGLAFGLCSVSGITMSSNAGKGDVAQFFLIASLVIEAICIIGLLIIGIVAIVRSVRRKKE